jgi:hypothetical protein
MVTMEHNIPNPQYSKTFLTALNNNCKIIEAMGLTIPASRSP